MIDLNKRKFINYCLLPISAVFYSVFQLRRILYRIGILRTHHFDIPVIVVGNITVGGSGKTPIVIALVEHFKVQGKKVGVVSRGYGGTHKKGSLLLDATTQASLSGDEPMLIYQQTKVAVMVNKNRAQAVQDLITQQGVDIVISDDGLQHYAMGRQVEIAVINGKQRFGNGFFLPAGSLREPISRLKSVDFILNNGALSAGEYKVELMPMKFINLVTKAQKPLDFFTGKTCYAVAGIGVPQRFFDTLSGLGIIPKPQAFPDHHPFTKSDLNFSKEYPIIMTAKDCVKCSQFATDQMWYLHSEVDLSDDFLTKLEFKL